MSSAPVTLLYLVKCPVSKKGSRKTFYKHFEYKVGITDQQIGQTKMQTGTNPSHAKELSVGKVLSLSSEYDYLTNADFQNITRAPTQQLVF